MDVYSHQPKNKDIRRLTRLWCYILALVLVLQSLGMLFAQVSDVSAAPVQVTNGVQFKDTNGNVIHAHGEA